MHKHFYRRYVGLLLPIYRSITGTYLQHVTGPVLKLKREELRALNPELINVNDLMEKLSPRELQDSAEAYFASIQDPSYHLAKPFGSIDEAPLLLINFAKIIQLGTFVPGQKLLEFGAGSCWAGRYFNQLGLEVVSLDISSSALKLGQNLKDSWKVFGNQPKHSFLDFDGTHIELPDLSIDRIVCLDCFHHVANPEQILKEFYRILKPNGLVVMSEPGPYHSLGADSQQEMKNYQVIENDIVIEDLWGLAKNIGFKDIFFSITSTQPQILNLLEYQDFKSSGLALDATITAKKNIEEYHFNSTIFSMVKGVIEASDSRSRAGLIADISLMRVSLDEAVAKAPCLSVCIDIKNISNKTWLKSGGGIGSVNLGAHLFAVDGKMISLDYCRNYFLVSNLLPGESTAVEWSIPLPPDMDQFTLEIDLVSEGICWYANNGSLPIKVIWPAR